MYLTVIQQFVNWLQGADTSYAAIQPQVVKTFVILLHFWRFDTLQMLKIFSLNFETDSYYFGL